MGTDPHAVNNLSKTWLLKSLSTTSFMLTGRLTDNKKSCLVHMYVLYTLLL